MTDMTNTCENCSGERDANVRLCESCGKDERLTFYLSRQTFVENDEVFHSHICRTNPELIRLIVSKATDEVRDMLLASFECEEVGRTA